MVYRAEKGLSGWLTTWRNFFSKFKISMLFHQTKQEFLLTILLIFLTWFQWSMESNWRNSIHWFIIPSLENQQIKPAKNCLIGGFWNTNSSMKLSCQSSVLLKSSEGYLKEFLQDQGYNWSVWSSSLVSFSEEQPTGTLPLHHQRSVYKGQTT